MATIEIDGDGFEEAREVIKKLQGFPKVVEAVIERHLKGIERKTKLTAPVDSGALRDSIKSLGARIAGDLISGEIEVGVPYASFVEKRVGFLNDEIEDEVSALFKDIKEAFEKLMR